MFLVECRGLGVDAFRCVPLGVKGLGFIVLGFAEMRFSVYYWVLRG